MRLHFCIAYAIAVATILTKYVETSTNFKNDTLNLNHGNNTLQNSLHNSNDTNLSYGCLVGQNVTLCNITEAKNIDANSTITTPITNLTNFTGNSNATNIPAPNTILANISTKLPTNTTKIPTNTTEIPTNTTILPSINNTTDTATIMPAFTKNASGNVAIFTTAIPVITTTTESPISVADENDVMKKYLVYIVLGGVAVVAVFVGCLVYLLCCSKKRKRSKNIANTPLMVIQEENGSVAMEDLYAKPNKKQKVKQNDVFQAPLIGYEEVGSTIPGIYQEPPALLETNSLYAYAKGFDTNRMSLLEASPDPYTTIVGRSNSFSPGRKPKKYLVKEREENDNNQNDTVDNVREENEEKPSEKRKSSYEESKFSQVVEPLGRESLSDTNSFKPKPRIKQHRTSTRRGKEPLRELLHEQVSITPPTSKRSSPEPPMSNLPNEKELTRGSPDEGNPLPQGSLGEENDLPPPGSPGEVFKQPSSNLDYEQPPVSPNLDNGQPSASPKSPKPAVPTRTTSVKRHPSQTPPPKPVRTSIDHGSRSNSMRDKLLKPTIDVKQSSDNSGTNLDYANSDDGDYAMIS